VPTLIYARTLRSWANGGSTPTASGTVTATAVPSVGRVTVAISWTGAVFFNVYRVESGGVPVPVRGAFPIGAPGSVTFSDAEAPLDIPVYYQVTSPTYLFQTLTSNTVTLDSAGWTWITHPTRPDLSTTLVVERNPDKARDIDRALFRVIGRKRAVPVTGGTRSAPDYTLDAFTDTQAERDNMLALLDDGSPLLFRTPAGYGFDPQTWLSIGPVTETNLSYSVLEWSRRWPLPCTEVDAPSVLDAPVVP
jgi:hypothetical protein